jgi:hypothetical protein
VSEACALEFHLVFCLRIPSAAVSKNQYSEKLNTLYRHLGIAIDRWSHLETLLVETFAISVGITQEHSAAILQHMIAFSLRFSVVNSSVAVKLKGSEALTFWNSLVEYIRELSGDRNYMAHTNTVAMMQTWKGPSDTSIPYHLTDEDWADADPAIGPALIAAILEDHGKQPMFNSEIVELINDFEEATKFLIAFNNALARGTTSQEIFSSPIVRPRPSRKIRLAETRKSQMPSPQSSGVKAQ